jgi:hypothetical protein
MLEWSRNPALEEELFARLRHKYIQDRTQEIHFSDTIHCLTKAYFNKVDPLPVSNDTLGMFSIGFALEEVLLRETPTWQRILTAMDFEYDARASRGEFPPSISDTAIAIGKHLKEPIRTPYQYEGLWFSPDYFTTVTGGEMDLKTTRMWPDDSGDGRPKRMGDRPNGFPEGWLKQFMGYAHRFGATHGATCKHGGTWPDNGCTICLDDDLEGIDYVDYSVAILYLGSGSLIAGTIRFDWDDVELNMAHHLHRASILEDQLSRHEPPTPFMYNEPWECKGCPYLNRCKTTEVS